MNGKEDELQFVQDLLQREKELLQAELKTCIEPPQQAELISKINLIKFSQALLRRCSEYQVLPRAVWRRVPTPQHQWSEYRMMEDFDTDDKEHWQEMPHIRLHGGEVIIG